MKKILLPMLLLLVLISCGKKSEENVFVMTIQSEGSTLNSSLVTKSPDLQALSFITEGIYKVGPDGKLTLGQAKEVNVSDDGLVYDIILRDDIFWSNGDPVTAYDFEYAWKKALDPKTGASYAYILYPILNAEKVNNGQLQASDLGVKVIDEKHLVVTLENATPYFNSLLSFVTYYPLNEKFVKEQGENYALEADNLISNGAFVLTDWVQGESMTYVKNDKYYNKENINLDKVVIKFILNDAARLNAYNNEEIDLTKLSSEQMKDYLDSKNVYKIKEAVSTYLSFNVEDSIMKNKNIRLAIDYAIDRDKLVQASTEGISSVPEYAFTPQGVGMPGVNKDFVDEAFDAGLVKVVQNKELANEYLQKGLKELGLEKLPEITLVSADDSTSKKVVEYIQEELRQVLGITLNVELMTYKERVARGSSKQYQVILTAWGADFLDPINFLDLFASFSGNNTPGYKSAKYDDLVKKVNIESDKAKRVGYLIELEKQLVQDVPIIPLMQRKSNYLVRENFQNIFFPSFGAEIEVSYIKVQK